MPIFSLFTGQEFPEGVRHFSKKDGPKSSRPEPTFCYAMTGCVWAGDCKQNLSATWLTDWAVVHPNDYQVYKSLSKSDVGRV